ncbi:hypothetical protein BGX38DRAFT_355178 [Terfezia claveryi]|nr:hypothetical protein BGX38DRAFT_355178 [Terfezia claveryi]
MPFRPSAFSFTRTADPGGDSLLSDMFSPTIPESLPSFPPSSRRSGKFSFSSPGKGGGGNKLQHLPPPPSPGMGRNDELPLPGHGYGDCGMGSNTINNSSTNNSYGSPWASNNNHNNNNNNYSTDIPSSPAAHLYSTPPTSKKPFRGFSRVVGVRRERPREMEEGEEGRFGFNAHAYSGSPPPLSTFYDGPLDGSLGLALEEDRDDEEERYDSISSYRRDAGFKDSGLGSRRGLAIDTPGSMSRKRTWASTLDEDEWYENGREGFVRGGGGGGGVAAGVNGGGGTEGAPVGQEERGQGGGGKRRIIDVVGSVASRLWEVVKGNASWGFYYPVSIVKGVGGTGGTGQKEQQQQQEVDANGGIGAETSRALAVRSNLLEDHEYSYTNGSMAKSTSITAATSLPQRPSSSASSRRSTLSAPGSPTKSRRRANTTFTRKKPVTALTATTVQSSLKDVDTDPSLRASWVLVPQQEFTPTTASLPASASRPPPVARGINSNQSYPHSHSRSASTANALGKKRPFRYPVGAKPTTAHVSFEVPGAPGRRARKKSLSWGGTGGWAGEKMAFGSGAGLGAGVGEGEEEDEVDESIRRWNERLREMIREGREALGSKVEVMYEDGL